MIIDCIGCLHGNFPKLDGGDLLIVTGDLTARDTALEHLEFIDWLWNQEYNKKIFILGNHDNQTSFNKPVDDPRGFSYLCDSGTEFMGLKIWGSPWTKTFPGINPHCCAFTVDTEEQLVEKWAMIPDDTDILITHGPPYGIQDKIISGDHVGSKSLALHIATENAYPKLKLWVWSHIHEAYGIDPPIRRSNTKLLNCSIMNENYQPVNKPIRIEI